METGETADPRNRTRGGNGRFRRDIATVEQDRRAAELAAKGWTWAEVAQELGMANKSVAWRAAQRAMQETAAADGTTEELRRQQLEELRQLRQKMWDVLDDPPPAISRTGKIVVDADGVPVPDATSVIAAAAVVLRANERVSKLRGTEAPRRSVSMSSKIGVSDILQFIEGINPAAHPRRPARPRPLRCAAVRSPSTRRGCCIRTSLRAR